jgi:HK97 family phage prohead protease
MHAPIPSTARLALGSDGTIEGYASLFGAIDQARDMVMPGAFQQTLKQRGIRKVPMLFQHNPAEPVGIWLDLQEDFRGLYARGRLIPDVARGRELLALLRGGAIDGCRSAIAPCAAGSIRGPGCGRCIRSICGKSRS